MYVHFFSVHKWKRKILWWTTESNSYLNYCSFWNVNPKMFDIRQANVKRDKKQCKKTKILLEPATFALDEKMLF